MFDVKLKEINIKEGIKLYLLLEFLQATPRWRTSIGGEVMILFAFVAGSVKSKPGKIMYIKLCPPIGKLYGIQTKTSSKKAQTNKAKQKY